MKFAVSPQGFIYALFMRGPLGLRVDPSITVDAVTISPQMCA